MAGEIQALLHGHSHQLSLFMCHCDILKEIVLVKVFLPLPGRGGEQQHLAANPSNPI